MISLALCLICFRGDASIEDLPEWKAYQAKLSEAYAMEIRWTRTVKTKVASFHLLFMRPDRYLLEEQGTSRTVWNGTEGIRLDLTARTFTRLKERPKFDEAAFLELPPMLEGIRLPSTLTRLVEKDWVHLVQRMSHIDALMEREWVFAKGASLPSALYVKYFGMWERAEDTAYRIKQFDTGALLVSTDFPVTPPADFKSGS